jgi:anti-sigma regulatory factor (Ser/Thr protein kinase)
VDYRLKEVYPAWFGFAFLFGFARSQNPTARRNEDSSLGAERGGTAVNEIQHHLELALAEQARLTMRYERSIGTSRELSAYASLRAATDAVTACEAGLDTEPGPEPTRFVFSVLCDRSGPGAARAEVRRRLRERVGGDGLQSILLLVSETVTNAVVHGECTSVGTVDLEVDLSGDGVWVGVTNTGPPLEHTPALPPPSATGGRGLCLVEALARDWGTGYARGNTSVWFEVDRYAGSAL